VANILEKEIRAQNARDIILARIIRKGRCYQVKLQPLFMGVSINDTNTISVIGFVLGVGFGFALSLWMKHSNQPKPLGYLPADLNDWMIPITWKYVHSMDDPIQFANDQLSVLERNRKLNEENAKALEGSLKIEFEKLGEIKKAIKDAETKIEQQATAGTIFSTVMRNLAVLRYEAETYNELGLPYTRRKRFLTLISQGSLQAEIEGTMNNEKSGIFQENPYGETFALIEAEWEALNEIPGLQNKIIHEMLSVKKDES
jgi:hypothetical protein